MVKVIQALKNEVLSDLFLVKVLNLKISLDGIAFHLLPLTTENDVLLGLGIVRQHKMSLYLSREGQTTIADFISWFTSNIEKFNTSIYLFRPEFEIIHKHTDIRKKFFKYIRLIPNYLTNQDIWGHISSFYHLPNTRQKFFYHPQWAYQLSQNGLFGKQILLFIELMLYNKLTLILDHTATYRITSNMSATTVLEGESALSLRRGTIIDIETTGLDPKTAKIISLGELEKNSFKIFFNHSNLNTSSFLLLINELHKNKEFLFSSPYYAYNTSFESKFFPHTTFHEIKQFPKSYRARRQEVFLPNDQDPGGGTNVPIWYKLFLSGGDIKKRKLYRRLILLHNRACLINQLALLIVNDNNIKEKFSLKELQFPKKLTEPLRNTQIQREDSKLVFKPQKYRDIYNYKKGFYSRYHDEGYLYKLGLNPAPDYYQKLMASNRASIRLFKTTPSQTPVSIPFDSIEIHSKLLSVMEEFNFKSLYEYQFHTYKQIVRDSNVMITAPTGNGKTEAFFLPVLQKILEFKEVSPNESDNRIFGIIFYPTKALSNDQMYKLTRWTDKLGITIKQLDGDVGKDDRKKILIDPPNILLTTPDWLHFNLHKKCWQEALKTIEFVIFDEIHTYTGSLGTHLFMLLQRLNRLLGNFQVIGASATIQNPKDFFRKLTGSEIVVVTCKNSLARRPALDLLLISPNMENMKEYNLLGLVRDLLSDSYGHTVLIFRNSQHQTELTYLKLSSEFGDLVAIHRGGLERTHREDVEIKLREGKIKILVCTSSLELGIDVGEISCVISPLVPINSLYQRIGRAGRKGGEALAILELSNDVISEYYIRHPKEYFTDFTPVIFETNNRRIVYNHLILADYEKSLQENEFTEYSDIKDLMRKKQKQLQKEKTKISSSLFSLRSGGARMDIKYNNRIIATRNFPHAFWEYFPEARRYIAGRRFKVTGVEKTTRFGREHYEATVEKCNEIDFTYIRPIRSEHFSFIEQHELIQRIPGIQIKVGKGKIISIISGAVISHGKVISNKIVFTKYSYIHRTFVLEIVFEEELYLEILHTLRHLLRSVIRMLLGLESEYLFIKSSFREKIVLYDSSEGGNGSILTIMRHLRQIFTRSKEILEGCDCYSSQGCPKCTFDLRCQNPNLELAKSDTLNYLKELLKK